MDKNRFMGDVLFYSLHAPCRRPEVKTVCEDLVKLIDDFLINQANNTHEQMVSCLKEKGDHLRYISEMKSAGQNTKAKSKDAYLEALEIAKQLKPAHPIRIGTALNFSTFCYEILNAQNDARHLAQQAFDDAVGEMATLNLPMYNESTALLAKLGKALSKWKTGDED
jgi:14-3-3 protein epsilon